MRQRRKCICSFPRRFRPVATSSSLLIHHAPGEGFHAIIAVAPPLPPSGSTGCQSKGPRVRKVVEIRASIVGIEVSVDDQIEVSVDCFPQVDDQIFFRIRVVLMHASGRRGFFSPRGDVPLTPLAVSQFLPFQSRRDRERLRALFTQTFGQIFNTVSLMLDAERVRVEDKAENASALTLGPLRLKPNPPPDPQDIVVSEKIFSRWLVADSLKRQVGHLSGSCRMPTGRMRIVTTKTGGGEVLGAPEETLHFPSCVDERLRVRGVGNLRVADASVLNTPASHTDAPTRALGYLLAEQMAAERVCGPVCYVQGTRNS